VNLHQGWGDIMITYLKVQNVGLLADIELNLTSGMTVITGETGSGKSMLVQAIKLLMGEKNLEQLRAQEQKAQVKAIFEISSQNFDQTNMPLLIQNHLSQAPTAKTAMPMDERVELHVCRTFEKTDKGIRSKAFINDEPVTNQLLQKICLQFIEIIGQNEHQGLLRAEQQFTLFDTKISPELKTELAQNIQGLKQAIYEKLLWKNEQNAIKEREDFLRFQFNELENAQLLPKEDEQLRSELKLLKSSEKIRGLLYTSRLTLMDNEDSVLSQLNSLQKIFHELQGVDESWRESSLQVEEAKILLQDALVSIEKKGRQLTVNPKKLQAIEDRLYQVTQLIKKYGGSIEHVLAKQEQIRQEIKRIDSSEDIQNGLDERINSLREKILPLAQKLSLQRQKESIRLSREVELCIKKLGLNKASLIFKLVPRKKDTETPAELLFELETGETVKVSETGFDTGEWFFCPNPGEPQKPLRSIASGGELSRISLAIKYVLKDANPDLTYLFDEVDTGIGGDTAIEVGRYLKSLSIKNQLLCITHLPQVAAFANEHVFVNKLIKDGRTWTKAQRLNPEERIVEIARMLGGGQASSSAEIHAKTLLAQSLTFHSP